VIVHSQIIHPVGNEYLAVYTVRQSGAVWITEILAIFGLILQDLAIFARFAKLNI